MDTSIVFHYDTDVLTMNQWYALVHLFRPLAYVLNSDNNQIHRSCQAINTLRDINSPLVLMSRNGKTSLLDYQHEPADTFVFWADHQNMPDLNVEWKDTIYIPTIGDGDMYSFQAGAILLFHRMNYGKPDNR